ncbi:MAG: YegS/Rv2252/BmrU family lipid kinase [Spirochaetia bacterium]|nr:YegS/Rv2252/BmrU family lipid kinase [Spirochaetia bacterium]
MTKSPHKRRILVLFRPNASAKRDQKLLPVLFREIQKHGAAFDFHPTSLEMSAEKLVRKHLKRIHTGLLVVGGDGTIQSAVHGLVAAGFEKKIPLGIVPHGTGNDFYRLIGSEKNVVRQVEIALLGKTRGLDLGECNGRIFVNGVGIGFDGLVGHHKSRKPGAGPLVYFWTVLKLLFTYEGFRIKKQDRFKNFFGKPDEVFLSATVGNGHSFGGGFKLTPRAKADDGKLDLCLLTRRNICYNLFHLSKTKNGTHLALPIAHYAQVKDFEIEGHEDLPIHIDGEVAFAKKIKIGLSKKKILVRMGHS